MTGSLDRDDPTPVLPAAAASPPPGVPQVARAAPLPASPDSTPPDAPRAGSGALWRVVVAACAGSLAATVLGLAAPADRQSPAKEAARVAAPSVEAAAGASATPEASGRPRPGRRPAWTRPARRGAPPAPAPRAPAPARRTQPAAPRAPARSGRVDPLAAARAHYLAGDLGAARAAVAALSHAEALTLSARLAAIAAIVGTGDRWPPPGGAAALERLLELHAAVAGGHGGPMADRVRAALAGHLVAKGRGLADEGRWEEALDAFREAARHWPAHPGVSAGLAGAETAAEGLYLEGYAVEEVDPASAERLYRRAARLARPDGRLAPRIAARLARMPRP